MIIERVKNEIKIKIPKNIDPDVIQEFIDYINYKTILSKSKANEKDVENISNDINNSWRQKNKKKFI